MDNLLLECSGPDDRTRGQLQLAMYAVHLSAGHSVYCKQIKVATIEQYVLAAATFLAQFSGVDYRKDLCTDSHLGRILSPVYRDLRKYEGMPERREAYNLVVHALALDIASSTHCDSLICALVDGFEQGLCAGYRLSEWAQPGRRRELGTHQVHFLQPEGIKTRAIIPLDIRCQTTTRRRAVGLDILAFPLVTISRVWLRFRIQKNGQNGEEKLFTPNPDPNGVCMVSALYRSLQRFSRLMAVDARISPASTPLSIYYDSTDCVVRQIVSSDIETFMRNLAMRVYNLHPVKDAADIKRWGTHSLRVGACVVLHAMGFSNRDIQWILRWRSTAFVAYLRNVAILSDRQNRAFNRAGTMPHLVS